MIRVIRNNSKQETLTTELQQCVKTFENSGYQTEKLVAMRDKAVRKDLNRDTNNQESLVFPLHYFAGVEEFKSVLYSVKEEISELIGNTKE